MRITDKNKTPFFLFVFFLAVISIAIAYYIHTFNLPWWIDVPAPLGVFFILYNLFDKFLWKYNLFYYLGVRRYPVLSGRWTGKLTSSYKNTRGRNNTAKMTLEIRQTATSIHAHAYFEKSESESKLCDFIESGGSTFLYYVYDNEPNVKRTGDMNRHRGFVKLKYLKSKKQLVGNYFNDLNPTPNQGDIELTFDKKSLDGCL